MNFAVVPFCQHTVVISLEWCNHLNVRNKDRPVLFVTTLKDEINYLYSFVKKYILMSPFIGSQRQVL